MRHFTYEQVLSVTKKIVEEAGEDYSYPIDEVAFTVGGGAPACVYAIGKNGEVVPSCLVGKVFAELGFDMADFAWPAIGSETPEGRYSQGVAGANIIDMKRDGIASFDDRAVALLKGAQTMQDRGHTWSESLANGIALAELSDSE